MGVARGHASIFRAAASTPSPASLLALVLALVLAPAPARSEFNYEVGRRIHERVSSFMGAPPEILLLLDRYRRNGALLDDMGAGDRDAFLRLNDAFMETYPQFESIYYGREDGVFAGHGFSSKIANYREPGHSGYAAPADAAGGDSGTGKHYAACINSTSGEGLPCRMNPGGKYTACVAPALAEGEGVAPSSPFDCALERCADEDSRRDCAGGAEGGNETEARSECPADVRWCSAYAVREAPPEADLGYVARSTHCIDRTGVPTQAVGEVVVEGRAEPGNCYFKDGATRVERSVEGDFAYCGGDGAVCNDTFAGAYISRDYDPRWRGWYIDTKAIQKPNWSPPYTFFTTLEMGITFSHPFYTMHDGRNVFMGVLAVDYTFTDVTKFLVDSYKDSPTVVAIFEQAEPHYMVASSTGSGSAKVVLADDESALCPNPEIRDGSCKAVRIKAGESYMDSVISSGYWSQREQGFPSARLVSAKAAGGDALYATQSQHFSIGDANLDWTILIMTPVETEGADQISRGSGLFGALVAVAANGFVLCYALVAALLRKRKEREVVVSDWRFMSAFVGGCALLNASCLSFIGPNTDGLCLTRMWLVHFFFVFALSFLFVKTYRMYKLVGVGAVRNTITHAQAARMTLPLILLQTVILLIFTFVDPNKRKEIITEEGSVITHRYVCAHDTPAFFIVMLVYEGGLLLIGCILAFKTRNLRNEFNESKQIILAMYDAAVIGSILLIVSNVVVQYQGQQRMLFTVGIFWTSCFAALVFVLPRLTQANNRRTSTSNGTVLGRTAVSGIALDRVQMQEVASRAAHINFAAESP